MEDHFCTICGIELVGNPAVSSIFNKFKDGYICCVRCADGKRQQMLSDYLKGELS